MENAIFLHLANKQYEVYTGQQTGGREIDFVARKGEDVVYIQSTYMMADESTRQREFGNLQAIRNNYPKYVVSLYEWTSGSSIDGVKHIHLGEFLQMSFGCFS